MRMTIVHVTASRFFGGPERQMLGLGQALAPAWRSIYVSFAEGGRCGPFLAEARRQGFEAVRLRNDTPRLWAAARELTELLGQTGARVACGHGYKSDLLAFRAGRRAGIPVVAVSRGWTGEDWKVRLYESLDRRVLRRLDRVVCVAERQADRVRAAGVPTEKVVVIPNAVRAERFAAADAAARAALLALFPTPPRHVVGAAGRLSPEKGFAVLVEAARQIAARDTGVGFVVFGDGPMRRALDAKVAAAGLSGRFVLPGFSADLDRFMPHFALLALPSYTEGMPNVALEAMAAGVPVVATAVGGTPEVIEEGETGFLVPAGDAAALADRVLGVLASEDLRRRLGRRGRERVRERFTFEAQATRYDALFRELTATTAAPARVRGAIAEPPAAVSHGA